MTIRSYLKSFLLGLCLLGQAPQIGATQMQITLPNGATVTEHVGPIFYLWHTISTSAIYQDHGRRLGFALGTLAFAGGAAYVAYRWFSKNQQK